MKKIINLLTVILVCVTYSQNTALASSHREAPLISNDPLADNTDLYAFRSPCDTNKLVLIANYIPFEHPAGGPNYYSFGPNIRYEIHIDNNTATNGDDIIYRFTFSQVIEDSTTFFNIRLGLQNLKTTYTLEKSVNGGVNFTAIITNGVVPPPNIGPRSIINNVVGLGVPNYDTLINRAIKNASTGERVYCGPADDPFFVDLGGAFDVGGFRTSGRDGLAKFNCHSIVVEVPISMIQKTGKTTQQAINILDPDFVIGVYATASRQAVTTFDSTGGQPTTSGNWIQVSRLGMPLTNEVVIPIGFKDSWNATNTYNDLAFDKYYKNPELALYMDDSQFGPAVPGLAALRIQSNSLGQFDFRNGKPGLFPLKGTAAVAGTALDDAIFGTYLLPATGQPRAVDLLPIFKTGVPNLRPYQLATGKTAGNPLSAGKPFINNFLPTNSDMLRLNMAVPVTPRNNPNFSSLGLIKAAVLGLTDPAFNTTAALQFIPNMDGFPNGRRLEDDVTTIELQAVGGVVLAAIGLWYDDFTGVGSPVTPRLVNTLNFHAGVTQNDTALKSCFPFVQAPWAGFTGAQYSGPLITVPVTFIGFTAERRDKQAILRWEVTNEINVDRYEVEHMAGSGNFLKIGSVNSRAGNINDYSFMHTSPELDKANYYRIKQVDRDGRSSYSPVRLVKFTRNSILTITPNPASDLIRIYSSESPIDIYVYDQGGRLLMEIAMTNGDKQLNISDLPKGLYILKAIKNGSVMETTKLLKQ